VLFRSVQVDDDDPDATVVRFPAPNLDPDTLDVQRADGKVTIRASAESSHQVSSQFVENLELPPEIDPASVTVAAEPDTIVVRIPKT